MEVNIKKGSEWKVTEMKGREWKITEMNGVSGR